MADNASRTVMEILAPDGQRRVTIFVRADGTFGFESAYLYMHPIFHAQPSWCPDGPHIECFAVDAETAEREARGRVAWLREMGSAD